MIYKDKKINLGKKVIVYNTVTGGMKLYGTFYEIASDGKVMENNGFRRISSEWWHFDDVDYLDYPLLDVDFIELNWVIQKLKKVVEKN